MISFPAILTSQILLAESLSGKITLTALLQPLTSFENRLKGQLGRRTL
jgi:hypothetical protein